VNIMSTGFLVTALRSGNDPDVKKQANREVM
jgi:hypothetical protein